MKTKITLLTLIVVLNFVSKAQTFVTIPDSQFAAWLQANIPSAMNGNLMDTSNLAVTTRTSIVVERDSIMDLSGIQYFHSLITLNFGNGNYSSINNSLTSLPTLPESLDTLICNFNHLTSFPTLPSTLKYLDCSYNYLTPLPNLPNSLITLICYSNQFWSLPSLPSSLSYLDCSLNLLNNLPALPNSLLTLRCQGCDLSALPTLPNALQVLDCSMNQITSLPALPNTLQYLECSNNGLFCYPTFPSSLIYISISNPANCLPNYVAAMDAATLSNPLCVDGDLTNNPNGCSSGKGIVGTIFEDDNSNCIMDLTDHRIANVHLSLYDTNDNLIAQTYSLQNGYYSFLDTAGIYTVKMDTVAMPFNVQCVYPGIDSAITLTSINPMVSNVNFNITCKPGFDIGVQSVIPIGAIFPGQQHKLKIISGEISNWYNLHCATGISGQVEVTVTGPVHFDSIVSGATTPSILGNVFTYSVADFGVINNSHDFGLLFTTDTSAQTGEKVCINVNVTPTNGDIDILNNNYQFCYQVSNSFDPNLKEVYPIDVLPGYQDYFTYTIHFQNTGNAPAMNIRLVDVLNNNLDLSTFQVINYSHYNITSLNGNVLTFRFPNIQLPDSLSDSNGSIGFVQYRIKPKSGLINGTQIQNTANIYFDYNSPITTNTTVNTFTSAANVPNLSSTDNATLIAPNPFTDITTITFTQEQKNSTIKIMDVLGKEIRVIIFTGKQLVIEKGEMIAGIYFFQVADTNGNVVNKKIVIQ